MEDALEYALKHEGPIAIRYPRGTTQIEQKYKNDFENLEFKTLKSGHTMAILAVGRMVETALKVAEKLKEKSYYIAVIEAPCICPVDLKQIEKLADDYDYLFTLEDGIIQGGFGEKVFAHLAISNKPIKGRCLGYESGIIPSGKVEALFTREHLDADSIVDELLRILEKES